MSILSSTLTGKLKTDLTFVNHINHIIAYEGAKVLSYKCLKNYIEIVKNLEKCNKYNLKEYPHEVYYNSAIIEQKYRKSIKENKL